MMSFLVNIFISDCQSTLAFCSSRLAIAWSSSKRAFLTVSRSVPVGNAGRGLKVSLISCSKCLVLAPVASVALPLQLLRVEHHFRVSCCQLTQLPPPNPPGRRPGRCPPPSRLWETECGNNLVVGVVV